MSKKLKCWKRSKNFDSGNTWEREGGGWVYLYKKGWFRGEEDKYVISSSSTGGSNPQDRDNKSFKTKSQALKFANSYMKENDKC